MSANQIPESTVARLPGYLRVVIYAQALRMPVLSSAAIAEMAGTNAAQVRKDLSYIGELGTRGAGYDVDSLIDHMSRALGMSHHRNVAIVGYGRLGSALRNYGGFMDRGFSVVAVFDADEEKVGTEAGDLLVSSLDDMSEVVRDRGVDIGVITTPAENAQSAAEKLIESGVTSILNFAPVRLEVSKGVTVKQVDLASEMQILSFHLSRLEE